MHVVVSVKKPIRPASRRRTATSLGAAGISALPVLLGVVDGLPGLRGALRPLGRVVVQGLAVGAGQMRAGEALGGLLVAPPGADAAAERLGLVDGDVGIARDGDQ